MAAVELLAMGGADVSVHPQYHVGLANSGFGSAADVPMTLRQGLPLGVQQT